MIKSTAGKLNYFGTSTAANKLAVKWFSVQSTTDPVLEPILPQHEPQPDYKQPPEIPAPLKNAEQSSSTQKAADDVILTEVGQKAVITLNRPKALNAINLGMVEKIYGALKKWESCKSLVIIDAVGEKAFCAGGDVKSLVIGMKEPNGEITGRTFFKHEYSMNYLIGTYKKPYVALLNGITMGGGVGLSIHGRYRVATENTLFAMPETAIGLFPDVGVSHFLSRLKGKMGHYLGLSGHRLKGVDVLLVGIATHFVPANKLAALKEELLNSDSDKVEKILNSYQPEDINQEFGLTPRLSQIEKCFSAPTMEEVIKRLEADDSDWARETLETLQKMSPCSLKVSKKILEEGSKMTLADVLQVDYKLICQYAMLKDSDFAEGVRALLIDKDQKPKWKPGRIEDITDDLINKIFKVNPENILPLDTTR